MHAAGIINGDIRVGGFPKVQHTFARVMGYVEQSDIHSPMVRPTVSKRLCPCEDACSPIHLFLRSVLRGSAPMQQ